MEQKYLDKQIFLQQYVLSRTSHKKSVEDLLRDGIKAWDIIDKWNWEALKDVT